MVAVPSLDWSTPLPAVALVMPDGSTTGGNALRHASSHEVFPAFSVYTAESPATRMVPSFEFFAVPISLAVCELPPAAAGAITATPSAPAATTTAAIRPNPRPIDGRR